MDLHQTPTVVGMDVGRITTRATLFGVESGKYRLLGQGAAPTSIGPGRHLGEGVGEALEALQRLTGRTLVRDNGSLIQPALSDGTGLDQLALVSSAGEPIRTVLLGLTQSGSVQSAQALADSLELMILGCFGLGDLADHSVMVARLVQLRPELVILTGGENEGSAAGVGRWVEALRSVCQLLPAEAQPEVVYAGQPAWHEIVQRRLEPWTALHLLPNLMPLTDQYDLVLSQNHLDKVLIEKWKGSLPGLSDLARLSQGRTMTTSFGLQRMLRFLSRQPLSDPNPDAVTGVMAIDLGGGRTTLTVAQRGEVQSVTQPAWMPLSEWEVARFSKSVRRWVSESVSLAQVTEYLAQHALYPALVPVTPEEWSMEQAWARVRLHSASTRISEIYPGAAYQSATGWVRHVEPIIASGSVFNRAQSPGQAILTILDGVQPRGITTIVLDRYQILPLLGQLGESLPALPVHLLESDAFQNLGTVIVPLSPAPTGMKILTMEVIKDSGNSFTVDVIQGSLQRLVIQVGEPAILALKPERETDIGFGGAGIGGRLRVTGGVLGVVMDTRGRPLMLPEVDEERVGLLQRWLWTLGGQID